MTLASALMVGLAVTAAHKPVPVASKPPAPSEAAQKPPIDYRADHMQVDTKDHRLLLDGNVDIVNGDLHLTGAHATVEFGADAPAAPAPKGKKTAALLPAFGGKTMQKFDVTGRVHVVKGARTADGEKASYDAAQETLRLSGPSSGAIAAPGPVLREGEETLSGELVTLRLATDDVEVTEPRLSLKRSLEGEGVPQPARIEARTLLLDPGKHTLRFSDQVVVKRGDLIVKAPRMVAQTAEGGAIDEMVLDGGVELKQGTRTGKSKRATYSGKEKRVRMTGEPELSDRGDVMYGETIDLAMDTKEVQVQRAHGRVKPDAEQAARKDGAP